MSLQFAKLSLAGFKSFVDPVDIPIQPGLTGVVGPNGCGKSNLVEALRWVMGETSARHIRAGGMDDLIFSGTALRPARNLATVSLLINNESRTAPAVFNDQDDLLVLRKLARGSGSEYRVNGKLTRARDVQALFADAASGASSPGLVSQGQVSWIIRAKPQERRTILEDAAGVAGLHVRRNEAEQRLRAAEANLERVMDTLAVFDRQIATLEKQARQAKRYQALSEDIQFHEALLAALTWQAAIDRATALDAQLNEAVRQEGQITTQLAAATTGLEDVTVRLEKARTSESSAAARLQHFRLERDVATRRQKELQARLNTAQQQHAALTRDIARETQAQEDDRTALANTATEKEQLQQTLAAAEDLTPMEQTLQDLDTRIAAEDSRLVNETQTLATARAEQAAQQQALARTEQALAKARQEHTRVQTEAEAAQTALAAAPSIPAAQQALQTAQQALHDVDAARQEAEQDVERTTRTLREAEQEKATTDSHLKALEAERRTITALLDGLDTPAGGAAVREALQVEPGYEAAVAAALGEDFLIALDTGATLPAKHWTTPALSDDLSAPKDTTLLATVVVAPAPLHRRIAGIGVVDTAEQGRTLFPRLKPGQAVVTRDGDCWRWDGVVTHAGAEDLATKFLKQKARLRGLDKEQIAAVTTQARQEKVLIERRAGLETAQQQLHTLRQQEATQRTTLRQAEQALAAAERDTTRLQDRAEALHTRLTALTTDLDPLVEEHTRLTEAVAQAPDLSHGQQALEQARTALAALREERRTVQQDLTRRKHDRQMAAERLKTLDTLHTQKTQHLEQATTRIASLTTQRDALTTQETDLQTQLTEATEALSGSDAALAALTQQHQEKKTQVETLDAEARQALKQVKALEAALTARRDTRVRLEAERDTVRANAAPLQQQAKAKVIALPQEAQDTLDGILRADDVPSLEQAEQEHAALVGKREAIGPVNLRAMQELEEMKGDQEKILREEQDLTAAIGELRQEISRLNTEARHRIRMAFDRVNEDFQHLFTRLFVGGEAHLELTESDDPLLSGLDIFVRPPGKKLQALSLLSGGEQALAALSLIFAMFLSNPSPVCVLDEVDAPLDDTNVTRLCDLLDDLSARNVSRFLVITHHRITMARMDRLYGVTMPERGVSKLMSMDMSLQEGIRLVG